MSKFPIVLQHILYKGSAQKRSDSSFRSASVTGTALLGGAYAHPSHLDNAPNYLVVGCIIQKRMCDAFVANPVQQHNIKPIYHSI